MDITEILGLAASISLLSGWRLYLCLFVTGVSIKVGWLHPPQNLSSLMILANEWVIGAAGLASLAEFFADKIMWLDTLWDGVHSFIRPLGGAMLALMLIDAHDPIWQVVSFILGGGGALLTHSAKLGTRAVINASPEPFSNIAVSSGEDIVTGGLLVLVINNPGIAALIAIMIVGIAFYAIIAVRRMLKRLFAAPAISHIS
jgi:hypothetical protein